MENRSQCDHCSGELFYNGDDQWWECADCGCAWQPGGQLLRRGVECSAPSETATAGYTLPPLAAFVETAD